MLAIPAPSAVAATAGGLSAKSSRVDVSSTRGSGAFGRWTVDGFGLPAYRYAIDEETNPDAAQPELAGRTDAWHQVGNDHIVANAYNHGYVQLWSQDRRYQWTNRFEPASDHLAGGFGYLRLGGKTISTMYDDRPAGARTGRWFGVGYLRRRTAASGVAIAERVYAPFGDAPMLLHDVAITNRTSRARRASWFELWDVNPYDQNVGRQIGLARPSASAKGRLLRVRQLAEGLDRRPLSIFAAALEGPLGGHTTSTESFFGAGGRADPEAVRADRLDGRRAPAVAPDEVGETLFAFRAPLVLRPGETVKLRYAYGAAHGRAVPALVSKARERRSAFARGARRWAGWVPQVRIGKGRGWLSRELQWDAYTLRSGSTYEQCLGAHMISQGGYYQYHWGLQEAYRDPLQHMLPIIYADPDLALDVIRGSAQQQIPGDFIPYGQGPFCQGVPLLGTSGDLDLWLLLSAAEYGLATRDLAAFSERLPFAGGGSGSLWRHLKVAFAHQESLLGPHGGYLTGANGDWSDFSTTFLKMDESILVTTQTAYVYPRLAELAAARGDRAFAARLRAAGARDLATVRSEWTGDGWYSRGYGSAGQIGAGVIFGEPQPWAVLAGAPNRAQARTLVANIRRFLTGVGAPPEVNGPARIGSSQSPARNDPDVTERSEPPAGIGTNNAVYVGGAWYAVNGWLTWALGNLEGIVPGATRYALDELERNTLTAHATAFPHHWNGIISVDDVCRAFYSASPEICGIGLTTGYAGQIMHQPAWSLFDTIRLAGIEPTRRGYRIDPNLPVARFELRLPRVGVAQGRHRLRGYVEPVRSASLLMEVAVEGPVRSVRVDGDPTAYRRSGGLIRFRMPVAAGRPTDWDVSLR
jgi:hypothetical protein